MIKIGLERLETVKLRDPYHDSLVAVSFCAVCSFSRLFTSSDRPSKKLTTSPALSYKTTTKQGAVRPVGDPNWLNRERTDGQPSRAFDFLQDDL